MVHIAFPTGNEMNGSAGTFCEQSLAGNRRFALTRFNYTA
jgi:hypothetical protein